MKSALAALSLFATTATAGDIIEYHFDMILFENLSASEAFMSDHGAREFINRKLGARDAQLAVSEEPQDNDSPRVYSSDDPAINYREMDTGPLDEALSKMEHSSKYRVLSRKTWKQTGFSDGDSIRIDIDESDPQTGILAKALAVGTAPEQRPYLSGSVTFKFSRYIHLSTDLSINHSANNHQTGSPVLQLSENSRISLVRKLRSNETHYVDHPLLGMLVTIKRQQITEPDTVSTTPES